MRKILLISLAVMMVIGLVIGGCAPRAPGEIIKCTGYDVGALFQAQQAVISDTIMEEYGIKVRTTPSSYELGRYTPLARGDVSFSCAGMGAAFCPEGLYEYADMTWGPQEDVRLVWIAVGPGRACAVRGDSDIRTFAELRGKRVANTVGSISINYYMTAFMRFGGLTWDDVIPVDVPSYTAAGRALDEGKVDACFLAAGASIAYEIESHPWGIRFLDMPESDTEGWTRVQEMVPYKFLPAGYDEGAGIEKPMTGFASPMFWITTASVSEDLVYFWTKALDETYPIYSVKAPGDLTYFDLQSNLKAIDLSLIPVHEGVIKYFKEKGLWTDEREARQKANLERVKGLRETFEAATVTASEQEMKAGEFPAFWMEQRTTAGCPYTRVEP